MFWIVEQYNWSVSRLFGHLCFQSVYVIADFLSRGKNESFQSAYLIHKHGYIPGVFADGVVTASDSSSKVVQHCDMMDLDFVHGFVGADHCDVSTAELSFQCLVIFNTKWHGHVFVY